MKDLVRDLKVVIQNIDKGRVDIEQVKKTLEVMVSEIENTKK